MRWRLGCTAGLAAALVSIGTFHVPARAADVGVSWGVDTRGYMQRRVSRAYVPRRTTVYVYPRYRYARARIIWQVDASSAQPAYVLRW